ncbi:hypothetical protein LMTR13_05935 [Bradyrhizobium icense]|uniref:Uncharacterized protein n=1 Tax=Bradyrhizobium icense TaxID=1274631 RepID=A0A1B1UAJ9_9BRAD|nr:hypothetical protein LMTR13_05935 [Bradyrhizobium icense]
MQRLLLFSPIRFLAVEAAEEAKVLALATVEDRHGPRYAAAMIASWMMRRMTPPGVARISYVLHRTLL